MTGRQIGILIIAAIIFAIGLVAGCQGHAYFNPCKELPAYGKPETVVKIDTVYVPIPTPTSNGVIRKDTITPRTHSDTVQIDDSVKGGGNVPRETIKDDTPTLLPSGKLEVPIESKVYKTDDYRAVVSGWRPNLDSIQIYRKTTTITETKLKKPVISLSVGPGASYDGTKIKPAVNVTLGFVIWSK